MDTEQLWNKFAESGNIDDYLEYKGILCNDHDRRNCPEGTSVRRTG